MYRVKHLSVISSLLLLASAMPLPAEGFGPDYAPPFESRQSKRLAPKLVVKTFLDESNKNQPAESASLVVGNKRISVREAQNNQLTSKRDNCATVFINSKPVFEVVLAGNYQGPDKKWINMVQGYNSEDVKLVCDQSGGTVKWLRSYPLPDGAKGTFVYQLKPLGDSRVELSWDVGCTADQMKANKIDNFLMYITMPEDYRQVDVEINGALLKQQTEAALKKVDQKGMDVWEGKLEKLVYNSGKPLDGFTVTMADAPLSFCTEKFAYGRYSLGFRLNGRPQGKLIIDLGEAAVAKTDAPPAVEGNDLWAQDALHMPKSPTRNLFPNPSFEQGLRYWRWWGGGAQYSRSDVKRYVTDDKNGLFGSSALLVNPTQTGSAPLMSFSLPGQKGKTYTVSFSAKAEKPGATAKLVLFSTKTGGQFGREQFNKTKTEPLTTEWLRFSQSFVSDGAPVALILGVSNSGGKVWLDGIQYEAGDKATEFVSDPLEGLLYTSDPDNNVELGKQLAANFAIYGKEGAAGDVQFTLLNFYKNKLWEKTFAAKSGDRLALPFDDLKLATGTYILRVKYTVAGTEPYYDYYRFTIINSLNGTHATKNLYGALFSTRISRTEDLCDLMRRCGFAGSTSYGPGKSNPFHYEIRKKYDITDYTHTLADGTFMSPEDANKRFENPDYRFMMELDSRIWRTPQLEKEIKIKEQYSDEDIKRVEAIAYKAAMNMPEARVWALATEEEIIYPPIVKRRDYKEFSKLSMAVYRGIKKANPKAIVLPSGGTSGYGKIRGKDAIEGYLASTKGIVKWDAVAIHPYGSCDGTLGQDDLDENIQMLRDTMAKYGYGQETPIFLNEGGGQGSPACWGDGPDYSYQGGQPSYDQGLREFLHAATMAREYIICLKYWPQLEHFNCWQGDSSEIVDCNLTPAPAMLGINTLGHLLAKPTFLADIRPAPGMRGYAFKDEKGNGVAAVWCTLDNVELGFERGPEMRVKFEGKLPEMIDLMGKKYQLAADKDGYVGVQLTPAPLFFRSAESEKLVAALKNAEVSGAGTTVNASFLPNQDGKIAVKMENLTGRKQAGEILINGKKTPFTLEPMKSSLVTLPESVKPEFGKMFRWNSSYTLAVNGKQEPEKSWKMDYFYVPHVKGAPDWGKVPAIQMTNLYRPLTDLKQTPGGHKGDIQASFKAAWDENNFYLRLEAEDDIIKLADEKFWASKEAQQKHLYILDGCLEVYFDCGANGRLRKGGFDLDDYRYDFCAGNPEGKSGPGLVNRLHEVFIEYAGGPAMPTKADASKGIKCEFTRIDATHYAYTITFEQKYIEPLHLQKGAIAGFALYLHDRMDDGTMGNKGLSLATEPGAHCDRAPQLWPLMILAE
ncbi:MAG: carbohydrate binding domain-containing protein [Victivallales bacterium]|jgi:hypothetical protein